jgi:SAM-dependent methyltransferase
MPTSLQLQIDTASESMTGGFSDYYQNMVSYFHQNPDQNLSYSAFSNRTNRATNALISEKEAIFYIVAYGWQHHQSMQHLLAETIDVTSDIPEHLRVVDYGCGQGVATLAFMDHLAQKGVAQQSALEVHLIEPSKVSLDIAKRLIERLAEVYGMQVSVHCQQCTLDDAVLRLDSECRETFHLLSNVVDIETVQNTLPNLAKQMQSCVGKNFLLATCPQYLQAQAGFHILRQEMDFANNCHDECWDITYQMYRVTQASWNEYTSTQRMLVMEWASS